MAAPDPVEVIQATLAPAFFVTATSVFLNFAQARLFRVVDRIRDTADRPGEEARRAALVRRARMLRNAIALGVLAVAFTVLTALLIMAGRMLAAEGLAAAAPTAFALAMLSVFAALCAVLWDTLLSVRGAIAGR